MALPPVALCVCLRCHAEGNWTKTDCTCTCAKRFSNECTAEVCCADERKDTMGEFPALSFDQVKKQALGFAYGCAVTVGLATLGEVSVQLNAFNLPGWAAFSGLSVAGIAATAARSAVSFANLYFTERNIGGK